MLAVSEPARGDNADFVTVLSLSVTASQALLADMPKRDSLTSRALPD